MGEKLGDEGFVEARSAVRSMVLMQLPKRQTFAVGRAPGDPATVFGLLKIWFIRMLLVDTCARRNMIGRSLEIFGKTCRSRLFQKRATQNVAGCFLRVIVR